MVNLKNSNSLRKYIMTMGIVIEILPWLSRALGKESRIVFNEPVNPKGETLQSLLRRIALKYDGVEGVIYDLKHGVVHEGVVIFVNNQRIPQDLKLIVKGGDRITVTPFYSGG